MGILEKKHRQIQKRENLQKIVLATVAAAGVLGVAVLAPNALSAMKRLGMLPTPRQKDSIRAARKRLVEKGLLVWEGNLLRLTKRGEQHLRLMRLHEYGEERPKRWDKKWRVLIFDIPEKRRGTREKIRRALVAVGFIRLQDSVWVYPYDCEDLVVLLKADFHIGKDVLYMIVDTIENDAHVRSRFGLPKE